MGIKRPVFAALVAAAGLIGGESAAVPLPLDGGWQEFFFDDVGSSWSQTFTFTIQDDAWLQVTDAFLSGDRFAVQIGGITVNTSAPASQGVAVSDDYDKAYAFSDWSSLEVQFAPGTYAVTGRAILSPFDTGRAAVQLTSSSFGEPNRLGPIPIPAGGVLLLSALGGIALFRRSGA